MRFVLLHVVWICAAAAEWNIKRIAESTATLAKYPRNSYGEKQVAVAYIKSELEAAGHQVFLDTHEQPLGPEWRKETLGHINDGVNRLNDTKHLHNLLDLFVEISHWPFPNEAVLAASAQRYSEALNKNDTQGILLELHFWLKNLPYKQADVVNVVGKSVHRPKFHVQSFDASPQPIYVVCAHYDSVRGSRAELDNAAGVGILLEVARNWKPSSVFEVWFVAFDYEEEGLIGSYKFLAALPALPQGLEQMFPKTVADVHNNGDIGNFISLIADFESQAMAKSIICAASTHANVSTTPSQNSTWLAPMVAPVDGKTMCQQAGDLCRSDHKAFYDYGISAVQFTDTANFRNACYHESCDVKLTEDGLQSLSAIGLMTMHSLKSLTGQ